MMNTAGTTTGRTSSAEVSQSNIPKNAVTYGRRMAGKSHLASGWVERLNAGRKKPAPVFSDHQRNHDTYRLAEALKPTDLALHLCLVDLMSPLPVLCTYKGDATGALVRHTIYP